jgi:hypothetical protein
MNLCGKVVEAGDLEGKTFTGLVVEVDRNELAKPESCFVFARVHVISEEDFAELEAYRNGGVTEELLRRNDGFIKVGRGCEIAIAGTTERLG